MARARGFPGISPAAWEHPADGAALAAASAALREWDRKSELSADRASLLVVQDAPVVFRALMKSAAGPRVGQMDLNEFFRQAQDYEAGEGALDSIYKLVDVLGESHPFPVARMTALQEWEKGGAYEAIRRGEYPRRSPENTGGGKTDSGSGGSGGYREGDPERDFERARSAYADEFANSSDPLAKAAGRVMDAMGGLFGKASASSGGDSGGGSPTSPWSVEDLVDDIFGPKRR